MCCYRCEYTFQNVQNLSEAREFCDFINQKFSEQNRQTKVETTSTFCPVNLFDAAIRNVLLRMCRRESFRQLPENRPVETGQPTMKLSQEEIFANWAKAKVLELSFAYAYACSMLVRSIVWKVLLSKQIIFSLMAF